jgi:pimeloyl-ACP methyl ester carboxylesterase
MEAHRRILAGRPRPATRRAASHAGGDYGTSDRPNWRDVNWPQYQRALTVDGRRVHYADLGPADGPPLLLVHGLGGRWQNWLETIPRVARRRRVVAVDLPGFGRSQLPLAPISIAAYANTVNRVCDLLELEAPLVVGNSLGGLVAAELALRYPQRVGSLAFVAAACLTPAELQPRIAQLALLAGGRVAGSLLRGPGSTIPRPRARHILFAGVVRHPTRIATDMLYELVGSSRPPGTVAALAALSAHDVSQELAQIAVRTLVLHGRNDMLIPCADAERLATTIPGAELVLFEDTGHMPMVERPVPFNDALLRFAGAL